MPAYNAKKHIKQSIESVLRQNYNNFELLIVDDGSTDDTLKIVKEYKGQPKVRYYTQKHKGISRTRNRLIKLSLGKYISCHDADDVMLQGKLKIQANYLDKHPKIGIVWGKAFVLDINKENKINKIYPTIYKKTEIDKTPPIPGILHCSSMIRKSEILKVGAYNENILDGTEDVDMWKRLKDVTKFKYLNRFFYVYRRHRSGITYSRNYGIP